MPVWSISQVRAATESATTTIFDKLHERLKTEDFEFNMLFRAVVASKALQVVH